MTTLRLLRTRAWLSVLLFLVLATPAARAQTPLDIAFEVDTAAQTRVSADSALRTNVVAYVHENIPEHIWDKFFSEQRVGDILFDTVGITRDSHSLSDIRQRMNALNSLVRRTVSEGGRVQLVFQNGIPRWLSSDPGNEGGLFQGGLSEGQKIWHSVPPADYGTWQKIARAFVHHFNNELDTDGRVYYILGQEPENYWVGTEQEFHRYYKHFVLGALEADPDVTVGGINTVGIDVHAFTKYNPQRQAGGRVKFETLFTKNRKPIIYNWLKFASEQRLPVDVVAWHDYPAPSPIPSDTANWVAAEDQIRQWLSEFGYSSDVELILNDWPEWKPVPYENDSEFQAAYVTSGLISMIENGSVKPLYLGLKDLSAFTNREEARKNASFGGGNGLFTRVGIAKPVYNAYRLMSMMKGRIVHIQTGDEFVNALATVDDEAIYVLLVNFIPSKRIALRNTFGLDQKQRLEVRDAVKGAGLSREGFLRGVLEGSVDLRSLGLSQETVREVEYARKVLLKGRQRNDRPVQARVRLTGLRPQNRPWSFAEYVIDKTHANSYTVREQILSRFQSLGIRGDRAKELNFIEEVNKRTGIQSALVEQKQVPIGQSEYEFSTTLAPHSVHLVVLRRAGAE